MINIHDFGIVTGALCARDCFVFTVILSGFLLMNSPVLEKDDVMWHVCARSIQDVVQSLSEFCYDAVVMLFVIMIQCDICRYV